MSHNYPYRGSTSDTDLRPEPGHYSSANRRHISANMDFYRPSQEPFSSSSSSSRGLTQAQDGAVSILNSCGLEASDLALLAELPEDVLTVESLPHLLTQIKGKRGAPRAQSPLSFSSSPSYHHPRRSSSRVWDYVHSQRVQYPLDHAAPGSLSSEQNQWRNSRTSSSVRSDLSTSLLSSRYRPGPSEHGKSGRSGDSFSSAGQERRSHPTGFSEPISGLPSDVYHPQPWMSHQEYQTTSSRISSQQTAATSIPLEKEALDFHGTLPTVFPYSCSLCDITVLSQTVWNKHINNSQHAEGQLSLLQRFPNWDCRMESVSRAKNQKRKDEGSHCLHTNPPIDKLKPDTKSNKKAPEKGKVVCVKFPPQSVDETYLRKLTEPFGKIIRILMFPSLAFVELSSTEQAKELVKFHVNYPPTVNGEQMHFSISNTFSFLQSSQVVSFTPVPTGEDGHSDLITITKRFGPPHYYLFLPSVAYVEMENASDAQKLVDYYSSNTLRINNTCIKVSFCGEYKTLVHVPSAKKYEEQKVSTKRTRSSSRDKEQKTESKRKQCSKDGEHEGTTSRSIEENTKTRSRSRERSDTKRKTQSRSRDKSQERSSAGSRSREKPNTTSSTDESSNRSNKSVSAGGEKAGNEAEAAPGVTETEKAALSAEESDIEGMEVIGEDGENLQEEIDQGDESDSEDKHMDTTRNKEQPEAVYETKQPERQCESISEMVPEDDEESSDFPVDLENCITLDELEDDQSDNQGRVNSDPEENRNEQRSEAPDRELTYNKEGSDRLTPERGRSLREEEPSAESRYLKPAEPPDSTGASPQPPTEEKPENNDLPQDCGSVQTEPEPAEPNRPVGTEFVRPVVGYFCNLCEVIYADEDEAKRQHCSSLMHYSKYQEKTGKNPWPADR